MPAKLLYIHGLAQSGRSATARFFEEVLNDFDVISPDLSPDPVEALGQLKLICASESPDFIYAAQSAGVLALHLHDIKKIIVNPFTDISNSLSDRLGTRPFKYPRRDGIQSYELTENIINHFAELEQSQFSQISDFDKDNTHALFIEVASDRQNYDQYAAHFPNTVWLEESEHVDAHMMLLREVVHLLSTLR